MGCDRRPRRGGCGHPPVRCPPKRISGLPASAYAEVFKRAVELGLGGNIHDALIAKTLAHHKLPLATLDRRQHAVALAFGVESTYLLSG